MKEFKTGSLTLLVCVALYIQVDPRIWNDVCQLLARFMIFNAHRQQEWVVAEPEEFQPFDLQALRNSADNKPSQSSSRREADVPQTA
jgi:hypothetical protein